MINFIRILAQDSVTVLQRVPVSDQINSVINNIATRLSVPTTKLFEVLAHQSYAEGVSDLLTAAIFLIASIFSFTVLKKFYVLGQADNWQSGVNVFWSVIGTVIMIASAPVFVIFMRFGVMEVLNPQYYAVKFILEALAPAVR